MGRDEMRAGDDDRRQTAEVLRQALDEGRLDLSEYDERLQQAYAAKTYGELNALLGDLPGTRPAEPVVAVPATGRPSPAAEWLWQVWNSWLLTVGITVAVWAVTSITSSDWLYFWPFWVAVPWGLVLVFHTVSGLASGAPRKMVEERERKALAKERKRQRKALKAEADHAELPRSASEKSPMSDSRVFDTPDHG